MGFLDAFSNNEISQCELKIHPFTFKMIPKTRPAVTMKAGHFVM
jgi:hypothetical protein